MEKLLNDAKNLFAQIKNYNTDEQIEIINKLKLLMSEVSPMKNEPIDCVLWVKNNTVTANDYNPNLVASKELELLNLSITEDGYTQPIVTFLEDGKNIREIVDGFHRNRIGREYDHIVKRLHGYLPVVTINQNRTNKSDRIAATIRHNRARGKHQISAMSEIVSDLKKRNWSNEKIGKNLGMEPDEVLRLSQISGIAELFSDKEFSKSWEINKDELEF